MDDQAASASLAVIWIGLLAWACWTRTIWMRWAEWNWDEQPTQFALAFIFHSTIAFILGSGPINLH